MALPFLSFRSIHASGSKIVGANSVEYYSELHSDITPSIQLLEDRSWAWLQDLVHRHRVVMLSKTNCVFSKCVKAVFHMLKEDAHIIDLHKRADGDVIIRAVERYVGYWITPQVFVNGMHYGGAECGIVNNTLRPLVPNWCDSAWRTLMEKCWATDPGVRPSFAEIANELRAMAASLQPKPQAQA